MKIFKVIEPVLHDGNFYAVDSEIELSDKEAKPLLDIGAIAGGAALKVTAPEGDEKSSAIKEAIAKLDAGVEANWLKDGKPKTEAIAAITGWPVSAAERDAAWEQVKPAA